MIKKGLLKKRRCKALRILRKEAYDAYAGLTKNLHNAADAFLASLLI